MPDCFPSKRDAQYLVVYSNIVLQCPLSLFSKTYIVFLIARLSLFGYSSFERSSVRRHNSFHWQFNMADHSNVIFLGNKLDDAKEVDTEPLIESIDTVEFGHPSVETKVDAMFHDTEVLHDLNLVDDSETQHLDGYDTVIVPDSDDEVVERSDVTYDNRGLLSESVRFVQKLAGDADKVKSMSLSPCKQQKDYNVNSDTCCYREHVAGQAADMIIGKRSSINPVTDHSNMLDTEPNLEGYGEISEVKCSDYCKELSEEKLDVKSKRSQLERRKVSIVYTRKNSSTTCNFEVKAMEQETRSPKNCSSYAGLSDVESQEPEDLANALKFVDQYLCVNAFDSSPVPAIGMKEKSLPLLSAKGAQNLVRWADLRDRAGETGIFQWDHNQDSEGQCNSSCNRAQLPVMGKKYGQIYVRRSPSLSSMICKEHVNPGTLCKEKAECFAQKRKDHTHSDTKLAVYDFENAGETKQAHEKKTRQDSDALLDVLVHEESTLMQFEAGTTNKESEHVFDVGMDTQLAAEAIQSLSYAASAGSNDVHTDQCPHTMFDESLRSMQKRIHAGIWSFPKKARSASRGIVSRPNDGRKIACSGNQDTMQISELEARRNRGDLSTRKCLEDRSFEDSCQVKFRKKSRLKGGKKVNTDEFKENLNTLVSVEDLAVNKVKCRRKHRDVYPVAGDLKLSSFFNVNECLMKESVRGKIDQVKFDLHEKSRNIRNTKMSEEEKTYTEEDDPAIHVSVDGKINQTVIGICDKVIEGGLTGNMLDASDMLENHSKVSHVTGKCRDTKVSLVHASCLEADVLERPPNWYLRDYPRGKRICRIMLGHLEGLYDFSYSSTEVSTKESNHYPFRSQFCSESCSNQPPFGSSVKRKRRSSKYISPCWSLPSKNFDRSLLPLSVDDPRCIGLFYENDSTANKRTSEQLTQCISIMQLDGAGNKVCSRLASNENRKSYSSNHTAHPNCYLLINGMNQTNITDGNHEKPSEKKMSRSPLTRELIRLGFNESMPQFTSKDSRRRQRMGNIKVLLSQNLDESTHTKQKKILMRLGFPMASCPSSASHFVADKFTRTRNMLEFIALGKPVVTHMWLESCAQAGFYMDERKYILRDVKKEQELGFKLPSSLDRAKQHPLLKSYRVLITPKTKPGLEMLTSLVKAVQGQVVNLPKNINMREKTVLDDLLILSCQEDQAYCVPLLQRGAGAYSSELLLNGIVIQKLEFERHQLFTNQLEG